jgi:hypothetical protein
MTAGVDPDTLARVRSHVLAHGYSTAEETAKAIGIAKWRLLDAMKQLEADGVVKARGGGKGWDVSSAER